MADEFMLQFNRETKEIGTSNIGLLKARLWKDDNNIMVEFKRKSKITIKEVYSESMDEGNVQCLDCHPWMLNIAIDDKMAKIFYIAGTQDKITYKPNVKEECGKKNCKNVDKLMLCTRCKAVKYCCKDCQVTDWQAHKPTCNYMKAIFQ